MVRIQAFGRRYPECAATAILDDLRASEYGRLDRLNQIYLDYTGGGLWADSQVDEHAALLRSEVFGNPHSASVSSSATTTLVERTRRHVLDYFNASGTYTAIFTANATAALKLVGEAFPFAPGGRLLMTADNHNSVNGIREFASARGAMVGYAPITAPELRLDRPALDRLLTGKADGTPRLFAFPAQSNFSGVKHPLDIVDVAKARGWRVLLDAAAFVPTNRLDLAAVQPDFVTLSFYKMFGYPTGVGCLLVHHDALPLLHRPWFAGGTVNFASVQGRLHVLSRGEAGFEDGTLNYLSIPAVDIGLRHLERIGIECIQTRVRCLTAWLLDELMALRHSTGKPMVRLYGPATTEARGGTIAFNLYDPDGHLLDYRRVEELAGAGGMSIRTGCFCNPGAGETAEGLTEEDMLAGAALGDDISLAQFRDIVQTRGGKSAGAMRVSFGIASNFADAARFLDFVAGFRDQTRLTIGAVTFDIESCRVIRDGS
jgi:selenocysteine lyase/cysteine desulfurase